MEPQPPAPPETLADNGDLENDLMVAEIADGVLPPHLSEQRAPKSPEQLRAEAAADLLARGEASDAKLMRGEELTAEEYDAWCAYLDPAERARACCAPGASRGSRARRDLGVYLVSPFALPASRRPGFRACPTASGARRA